MPDDELVRSESIASRLSTAVVQLSVTAVEGTHLVFDGSRCDAVVAVGFFDKLRRSEYRRAGGCVALCGAKRFGKAIRGNEIAAENRSADKAVRHRAQMIHIVLARDGARTLAVMTGGQRRAVRNHGVAEKA